MGLRTDQFAVVDNTLCVHGTKNLRIVDGSVFPTHVTGNPWATITALAEKAAGMILGKHNAC